MFVPPRYGSKPTVRVIAPAAAVHSDARRPTTEERPWPRPTASAMARTSPGNPAPEPRSAQIRASGARSSSWSESAICRVHRCEIVEGATRFVVRCQLSSKPTNASSRSDVSRETDGEDTVLDQAVPLPGREDREPMTESPVEARFARQQSGADAVASRERLGPRLSVAG